MTMVSAKTGGQVGESPELQVSPYEDIDTRQSRITGEKLPGTVLGLCDKCHWCYTLLNEKGAVKSCPVCKAEVSPVPMRIEEICTIEDYGERGLVINFDRKLPLR